MNKVKAFFAGAAALVAVQAAEAQVIVPGELVSFEGEIDYNARFRQVELYGTVTAGFGNTAALSSLAGVGSPIYASIMIDTEMPNLGSATSGRYNVLSADFSFGDIVVSASSDGAAQARIRDGFDQVSFVIANPLPSGASVDVSPGLPEGILFNNLGFQFLAPSSVSAFNGVALPSIINFDVLNGMPDRFAQFVFTTPGGSAVFEGGITDYTVTPHSMQIPQPATTALLMGLGAAAFVGFGVYQKLRLRAPEPLQ